MPEWTKPWASYRDGKERCSLDWKHVQHQWTLDVARGKISTELWWCQVLIWNCIVVEGHLMKTQICFHTINDRHLWLAQGQYCGSDQACHRDLWKLVLKGQENHQKCLWMMRASEVINSKSMKVRISVGVISDPLKLPHPQYQYPWTCKFCQTPCEQCSAPFLSMCFPIQLFWSSGACGKDEELWNG